MLAQLDTIFKGKESTLRVVAYLVVTVIVTSECLHISEDFVFWQIVAILIASIPFLSLFSTDITEVMCSLIVLVCLVDVIEDLIRTEYARDMVKFQVSLELIVAIMFLFEH